MMRLYIASIVLLIGVLFLNLPQYKVSGQSGIIVDNADSIRTVNSHIPAANLDIQAHIAVQYSNGLRHLPVDNIPAPLQTLLARVAHHLSVQYANGTRQMKLTIIPATFQQLLSTVSAKIGFQYANGNRQLALAYPRTLVNDTTIPVISAIAQGSNGNGSNITWTTNEFTRYQLGYGAQSGHYTEAIEEPLYAKQHSVTLPNLVAGQRYYFQITAIDRSDNQTVSAEHSLVAGPTPVPTPLPTATPAAVFLPLIEKR